MFLRNFADASDVSHLFCMRGMLRYTHATQDMTEATDDEALVLQGLQIEPVLQRSWIQNLLLAD